MKANTTLRMVDVPSVIMLKVVCLELVVLMDALSVKKATIWQMEGVRTAILCLVAQSATTRKNALNALVLSLSL